MPAPRAAALRPPGSNGPPCAARCAGARSSPGPARPRPAAHRHCTTWSSRPIAAGSSRPRRRWCGRRSPRPVVPQLIALADGVRCGWPPRRCTVALPRAPSPALHVALRRAPHRGRPAAARHRRRHGRHRRARSPRDRRPSRRHGGPRDLDVVAAQPGVSDARRVARRVVRRGHDWVLDTGARQFTGRAIGTARPQVVTRSPGTVRRWTRTGGHAWRRWTTPPTSPVCCTTSTPSSPPRRPAPTC